MITLIMITNMKLKYFNKFDYQNFVRRPNAFDNGSYFGK